MTTPRRHTGRTDFERYNRDGYVACEANDRAVSLSLRFDLDRIRNMPCLLEFWRVFAHDDSASLPRSYAYDDWAIGQVAQRLGLTEDAEFFARGALSYKNL